MRKAKTLLVLLFVATVGIGAALMQFGSVMFPRAALEKNAALTSPVSQDQTGQSKADNQTATIAGVAQARPTFDVVRVEKDGSVVMAGQAESGSTVTVRNDDKVIGRTTADENGEWILQPDKRLAQTEHGIQLSAQSADKKRTLFSKQSLALSLSDPKQGEPLVALTEDGKATRILQMPTPDMLDELAEAKTANVELSGTSSVLDDPAETNSAGSSSLEANAGTESKSSSEPVVSFASIDYEDADQKSMIYINGIGTPGSRVAVFVDNKLIGHAVADASGSWNYSDNRVLDVGDHILRADVVDKENSEKVLARAEVSFNREPLSPVKTALFDVGSKLDGLLESDREAKAVSPQQSATRTIIVQRGDTLWHIAERYYGQGARYTLIFKNNREQIRNPDRIYPQQELEISNEATTPLE